MNPNLLATRLRSQYNYLSRRISGSLGIQNNENLSSGIIASLRLKFGCFLPFIIFLSLLSILVSIAVFSDDDSYFDLSAERSTPSPTLSPITFAPSLHNQTFIDTSNNRSDTNKYHPVIPTDKDSTEASFLALAFFSMMTTWVIIQTIRTMRNARNPWQMQGGGSRNDLTRDSIMMQFLMRAGRNADNMDPNFYRRLRMALTNRDFNGNDYELLQLLDEDDAANRDGSRLRGASDSVIDSLPSHIYHEPPASVPDGKEPGVDAGEDEEKRTCTVCLGGYQEGDIVQNLPCMHQFHKVCVDEWLRQNALCPICKGAVG